MATHDYDITGMLTACTKDISAEDPLNAEALARAYDLLDMLIGMDGNLPDDEDFREAASAYLTAYEENSDQLGNRYDEQAIKKDLLRDLRQYDDALHEARFRAAAAASLHEFAKNTFSTWQTAGIFARRRALKELRQRAGFRLESHRIGNYVAKTFDLMNEAQADFAKAQQARFSADISYKIKPGIYAGIRDVLRKA